MKCLADFGCGEQPGTGHDKGFASCSTSLLRTIVRLGHNYKFYKHLMASSNAILQLLFSIYCNSEFKTDFSLTLAQLPINLMRKCVYTDFKAHITFWDN